MRYILMGLIDLLFGQSKCKNMNDIKLRNDDIPDWMLNEFPHVMLNSYWRI